MGASCHSIEDEVDFEMLIKSELTIGFCYPIYGSREPRIMREFVSKHMALFQDKKLVIFCTQMIFSGDGTRAFAAMFPRNHVKVIYTEHFLMPNNITNVAILPNGLISDNMIKRYVRNAERKMQVVCSNIRDGKIKKRGFCIGSRLLGAMQAWVVPLLEARANKSVKISLDCDNCALCVSICPMKNLVLEGDKINHKRNCTICYRCVNECPRKAITVAFHSKVKKQFKGGGLQSL